MSVRSPEESHQPPLYLLTGLLIGLLLGIAFAWWVMPVRYRDASPALLSAPEKDTYRRMVALAYDANGDTGRAAARLALLDDADPAVPLEALAEDILAADGDPQQALALRALAAALRASPGDDADAPQETTAVNAFAPVERNTPETVPTATIGNPIRTATPSRFVEGMPTLRPTTPPPAPSVTATPAAPFLLIETLPGCDPAAVPALLEVLAEDASGQGIPGQRVRITWEGGEEIFFTGLAPEISPGYADYLMSAGVVYSVRIGDLGDSATGVTPPTCTGANGSTYAGVLRLRFRQEK